jgi:SEC-C motif
MAKRTTLPFVCRSCGRRYGDGPGGSLLAIDGDVSDITLKDNFMQCQCGQTNRQALPNGSYNVRGGRWEVARQITRDVLSAIATREDIANLAELIKEAQARGAGAEQIAAAIESNTPFSDLAATVRKFQRAHPPGWGAWILAIIIPLILSLIVPSAGTSEPAHQNISSSAAVQSVSPHQIDEITRQVANELKRQDLHSRQRPGRAPERNTSCICGSGVKYKKCCGDPAKRTLGERTG